MATLRAVPTHGLERAELRAIHELLVAAFGDEDGGFGSDDWQHALGGTHVILEEGGLVLAHASVVERPIAVARHAFRTGYVEAVGTRRGHEGRGYGSAVMGEVNEIIRDRYELGALGTGRISFYERLGWERWRGPSFVRGPDGQVRTPDEDGYILVLRTSASADVRLDAAISCDWRPGDVW